MNKPAISTAPGTRWGLVALAVAAGIVGALHVGKVPPALPILRDSLGLGMVTAGWVASLFNGTAAALGLALGWLLGRMPLRPVLVGCLMVMAGGSALGAAANGASLMLSARLLEGLGFIGVITAAPRLIAAATASEHRGLAFGIWGSYLPAGTALAMLAAPPLLAVVGWRGLWLINAAVALTFALLVLWRLSRESVATPSGGGRPRPGEPSVLRRAGPWLFAISFMVYAMQWMAVMIWMPTFLMESGGWTLTGAAQAGALVVSGSVVGNVTGAWLMHRGVPRWRLMGLAFVTMGLCAILLYSGTVTGAVVPVAVLFSVVGGLLPAAALAGASAHAPSAAQVSTANGLVIQGSNGGSLLGPPAMALAVGLLGGWDAAWMPFLVVMVVGLALTAVLRAVDEPSLSPGSR